MGDEVGDYFAKIETNKRLTKQLGNVFDRLGGIEIYSWDDLLQVWKFVDSIHETGPIAKNLVIVPITKRNSKSDGLTLKVKMAKGLWRLDYLGITSICSEATPQIVYPQAIEVIDGADYGTEEIRYTDDRYLISFPGNEFKIQFHLPTVDGDYEHELFLSATGYYLEWIRQEWLDGKDLPKLRKLIANDVQTWSELALEFKSMEAEMETVFWNSKYSRIQ